MTRLRGRLARWAVTAVVLTVTSGAGPGGPLSRASGATARIASTVLATASRVAPGAIRDDGTALRVYYTNPVLVRAGERVLMPVDVVCATAEGDACAAMVTLGTRVGGEQWHLARIPSSPFLTFDLTRAASRAIARAASGAVEFFIRAEGPGGVTAELGEPEAGRALRFFAVRSLRTLKTPSSSSTRLRHGRVELFLPWGTGPLRAGLAPGNESATIGPSSFDVDAAGRIHLADPLQRRVVTFEGRRLVEQTNLDVGVNAILAVDASGRAYLADRSQDGAAIRSISGDGSATDPQIVEGAPSEIQAVAGSAYLRSVPLDAVHRVDGATRWSGGTVLPGLPVPGGNLVRSGRDHSVRLAVVADQVVREAFALSTELSVGEVALARSDGHGRYLVVMHVVGHDGGDRFQVVRVAGGRVAETFAVATDSFTDAVPLARFRVGPDGDLYQLKSFPDGIRVVRFGLGGGR